MGLDEKYVLTSIIELSLIKNSLSLKSFKELLFLGASIPATQTNKLKSALEKLYSQARLINGYSLNDEIVEIEVIDYSNFINSGNIDLTLVVNKFIRRILISKLYQEFLIHKNLYTHFPLIELANVLEITNEEIFHNVEVLNDEGVLDYSVADGGRCTSNLTTLGYKVCEDRSILFDKYCELNLIFNINDPVINEGFKCSPENFISIDRIENLKAIKINKFDLTKLIILLEELNKSFKVRNNYCVIFLIRAIIDHVPPIFQMQNFNAVVNQYKWSTSNKKIVSKLSDISKNLADNYLHEQINNKYSSLEEQQLNFTAEMDVLLSEIIILLKNYI